MVFKCKICGGNLNVNPGERVTECEYCGVKQTIPSFIEPKVQEVYNRANSYLMNNEFDKAENLFNQILFDNKQDAEAYWNILMCRYGVTYVKDPATSKYVPTCNRTLYAPIFNDENYQNALKYADDQQRSLYIENAQTIDKIQKGILAVSKNEKPFDIFISYKETDANGTRTQDSVVAQELYNDLTAEGYKVFFSRITLEDKVGTEYEPYIYAALASSKIMITVCSSREYIEAPWVKNEWSRFLSFAVKDNDKTLIPLYYDMSPSELPDEFAHLNSYDMKENGFKQELVRGIKKLIPLPIMLLEQRKKRKKLLKKVGLVALACAIIGVIVSIPWFAKLPDYNAAMQLYYDKNYPEATWAFDELGSYRDSKEMKEKAALSWRKSLASVVAAAPGEAGSSYYISQQGSIELLDGYQTVDLKDNEHGKYISIVDSYPYALHEDGFVENAKEENLLTEDWTDIIQISPKFYSTSVALTDEGKMVYGSTENSQYGDDDRWLRMVSSWENIVSFEHYMAGSEGTIDYAMIVGIKADGTLCGVFSDVLMQNTDEDLEKILDKFFDVKDIAIGVDWEWTGNNDVYEISILALTKHNTLQLYSKGEFSEVAEENISAVYGDWYSYMYKLSNSGELLDSDDNVILNDVVDVCSNYCITRSGSIYYIHGVQKEQGTAVIYDEWIERLN